MPGYCAHGKLSHISQQLAADLVVPCLLDLQRSQKRPLLRRGLGAGPRELALPHVDGRREEARVARAARDGAVVDSAPRPAEGAELLLQPRAHALGG